MNELTTNAYELIMTWVNKDWMIIIIIFIRTLNRNVFIG